MFLCGFQTDTVFDWTSTQLNSSSTQLILYNSSNISKEAKHTAFDIIQGASVSEECECKDTSSLQNKVDTAKNAIKYLNNLKNDYKNKLSNKLDDYQKKLEGQNEIPYSQSSDDHKTDYGNGYIFNENFGLNDGFENDNEADEDPNDSTVYTVQYNGGSYFDTTKAGEDSDEEYNEPNEQPTWQGSSDEDQYNGLGNEDDKASDKPYYKFDSYTGKDDKGPGNFEHNYYEEYSVQYESPKPVVYETQTPNPVVYETQVPKPVVYETQTPKPVVYETQTPKPLVYETQMPNPSSATSVPSSATSVPSSSVVATQKPLPSNFQTTIYTSSKGEPGKKPTTQTTVISGPSKLPVQQNFPTFPALPAYPPFPSSVPYGFPPLSAPPPFLPTSFPPRAPVGFQNFGQFPAPQNFGPALGAYQRVPKFGVPAGFARF